MIRLEDSLPDLERPDLVAPNPQVESLKPLAVGKATACQLLSVSPRTLKRLVDDEGLPCIKLLGKDLYPVASMQRWLLENAKGTTTPPTE